MAMGDAQRYSDAMACRSHGYALFHPPRSDELRLGMVGYVDDNGVWHQIANLAKPEELRQKELGAFTLPRDKDPDRMKLGPVVSGTVRGTEVALASEAEAAALGLPLDVSGVIEYASEDSFGAILMCDDEVVIERYDVRDPFVRWLKKNHRAILRRHRDVTRYGVCIALNTWSAQHVFIRTWSGAGHSVRVGFKVGATGIGNVKPEVSYYRASHGAGWQQFDGKRRVVFFSGVKFSYNLLGRGREDRDEAAFRGGSDAFVFEDPDDAGMAYNVKVEDFGRRVEDFGRQVNADGEDDDVEDEEELDDY
ncbi:hypothetical protein PG990_001008 [Apiospora arundinis]